jgi:hypothetical protein
MVLSSGLASIARQNKSWARLGGRDRTTTEDLVVNFGLCRNHLDPAEVPSVRVKRMIIHMVKPIPMKQSGPSRITIAHAMWGRNYAYPTRCRLAMLVRRVRDRLCPDRPPICIGTSATMATEGDDAQRAKTVAVVSSRLFGTLISSDAAIGESLERATDSDLKSTKLGSALVTAVNDTRALRRGHQASEGQGHSILPQAGAKCEPAAQERRALQPGRDHGRVGARLRSRRSNDLEVHASCRQIDDR